MRNGGSYIRTFTVIVFKVGAYCLPHLECFCGIKPVEDVKILVAGRLAPSPYLRHWMNNKTLNDKNLSSKNTTFKNFIQNK